MIPSKRRLLKNLAKLFDLSALVASFAFAGIVAYSSLNGLTLARLMGVQVTLGNCLLFILLLFYLAQHLHSLRTLCLEKTYETPC